MIIILIFTTCHLKSKRYKLKGVNRELNLADY
jgi:hypothetical protein